MAFKVSNILQFPQPMLQHISREDCDVNSNRGLPLLGGILSDTRYVWHAKGPCLEVRSTKTGTKVGAWTFGCILKDSNTKIVCVEEIRRPSGMLSLLVIALECTISGGLICIFDVFSSKVLRAIQVKERIISLHVLDSGCEVLNFPGPLRNFDGIISVGTEGGNVFLVDICRQICEEALHSVVVRDELCPCRLILLTLKDIPKIEYYKEKSMREGDHLAIHLNVVLNNSTHHFTLKGPKGDDRIFVNREEVVTSALYYCSQLTSLLVGFNFGAFQLWDLTTLNLVYTSPVCEEHLPITHFALQEPADDPRAFCYIWASYSNMELFQSGLPFAVMYSLCYESKEYHEGYGYLYQDFQSCSIRFQVELGPLEEHRTGSKVKGGMCMSLQPICKTHNKYLYLHDVTGDILALCAISWSVWFTPTETQTYTLVFDLNQWYKEQMPDFTKWSDCSNYILKISISDLITGAGLKGRSLLDIRLDNRSLRQFTNVQRLEEHFCPSALSFNLWGLKENDIILFHSEGLQKALLGQIETAGPLCLIRPSDVYRQIISLGLTPLFTEVVALVSTEVQREVILNVALEHQLVGWLCKCASEWANGSFSSAGCSLDVLINWAFQRAITLKSHCDNYCKPLFDYSQLRFDNNTSTLLNSCIRQINNLSVFYSYILNKLPGFISNLESINEQQTSLKMVSVYFEVLQWLVNVGLLPECHPSTYPRIDGADRVSAPYPVQELTEFYNKKRVQLQMLTKETFISNDSLLFIDNLVNNKCGAQQLERQWQDDGGSGLYPPPSLQSLLRTYLIEGTDISHKHSLIIYVFLDLAMALDQSRYASVITHLIKFPAVFKVSSSIIKITQAFWQLDHGDFTTAMEQLLDPFVLSDDLQPWHHAIAMRALLLQDQYNFALLYMQVRKPPITDEKDVLTAISLFIANNMLDEAFYFKNQHRNNNEEKLLMHLFNECNKNDSLQVLLYRCLDTNEERTFFKYLRSVENPTSHDLQVFYYLLRSRFIEAFDTHQNLKKRKPESQGLVGQRNATKTDQIVRIFKTLLPDVNRNLVDIIQKERSNLWKEVVRPTPLSVFVHNTNEQVQYKSTVIHAALAKAKQTFYDSPATNSRDIVTEETPFLRTPKVSRMGSRHVTPVITPKIIEMNEGGEELSPSPSKKLKLTPRPTTFSPTRNLNVSIHSKMLTPIVKRKTSLQKNDTLLPNSSFSVGTPQSILKIRGLVKNSDVVSDETMIDDTMEDCEVLARMESSPRKSGLGLLPRKSLPRAQRKPHVQFNEALHLSSSFSDQSVKPSLNNTTFENMSGDKSTLSSNDVSLMISSKNSSSSNTEEVFYSPNSSLNDSGSKEEQNDTDQNIPQVSSVPESAEVEKTILLENIKNNRSVLQSPKARRSYKRSFGDTVPACYSPRITRHSAKENDPQESDTMKDSALVSNDDKDESMNLTKPDSGLSEDGASKMESPSVKQSPRLLQRVKGRKSLSRKVLEHNTFSRVLSSPSVRPVSVETSFSKSEKTVITEKTDDQVAVTTKEAKEEITLFSVSDTSLSNRHYNTRSSVHKEGISDISMDTECDITFSSPVLPDRLKMSDSLKEYVKSITSKQLDIEEPPVTGNSELQSEQSATTLDLEEFQDGRDMEKRDSQKGDEACEIEPMDVYQDLSNDEANVKELVTRGEGEICIESVNYSENTYNELEKNIFEPCEILQETVEKRLSKASHFSSFRDSDSFCVPDAEKAFLGDHSRVDISTSTKSSECEISEFNKGFILNDQSSKDDDVIEISSSSDEQNSRDDNSEMSDSEEELNISYERNIHVEENSRSLADSADSRTTDNSGVNEDDRLEFPIREIVIEDVELLNYNELEVNADDDSAEEINDEQQSSDENEEHSENEEMPLAQDDGSEGRLEDVEPRVPEHKETHEYRDDSGLISIEEPQQESVEENDELSLALANDGLVGKLEGAALQSNVQENKYLQESHDESALISMEEPQQETVEENEEIPLARSDGLKDKLGGVEVDFQLSVEENKEEQENQDKSAFISVEEPQQERVEENVPQKDKVETSVIHSEGIEQIGFVAKVNQSTSITDFCAGTPDTIEKEKRTTDQSTNTTFDNKNITPKMYHPKYGTMKLVSEDQTMSSVSSDTTEGDLVKHEIVVKADIHTPTKRKAEEPLIKRVTRRSSALLQSTESDKPSDMTDPEVSLAMSSFDIMDQDLLSSTYLTPRKKAYVTDILEDLSHLEGHIESDSVFTPETRRRSCSMTASSSRTLKSLRSRNESHETQQTSSSKPDKKEVPRLRKMRSVSVDEVVASPRRRSLRRNSTDAKSEDSAESNKPKPRGRTASVAQLPIIAEEKKDKDKPVTKSKTNSVEDYTTARRLTRRQASLIKDVKTPSGVTAQDDSDVENTLDVDIIDPIKLLDKEPFQGSPDPDEEKIYEPSSPSNSTASSFNKPAKRASRSTSLASDSSAPAPSTPKRRAKPTPGQMDSPSQGVRTRSRRQSETSSIASEKSDPPTPPKRSKRRHGSKEPEEVSSTSSPVPTRSTRSRANSTSSTKSDTLISPKRKPRNRRLISAKSELPEITEEKSSETGGSSEKSAVKRSTKKKSS